MQKGDSSGDGDRNSFRKSVVALLLIDPSKYLTSCLWHSNVPPRTGAGCVGVGRVGQRGFAGWAWLVLRGLGGLGSRWV